MPPTDQPSSPSPQPTDEFYIGYLPQAPRGVARTVKVAVAVIAASVLITAAALAGAFRSPGPGTWTDAPAEFAGSLSELPYPTLRLTGPDGSPRRALLVDDGKHGSADRVRGMDGQSVRIRGTVLERDGRMMIEIQDGEAGIRADSAAPATTAARSLGPSTLTGEIIDPKCFLGAMKPGNGKLHKACAIRCISGGIPPMLAVADGRGGFSYYLLATAQGGPLNRRVLPFVGESVVVNGQLEESDGLATLRVSDAPDAIRRADAP